MAARRIPIATVGIVGAGQLGLMLCDAARRLGIATRVLAASDDDPAVARADSYIIGDRLDPQAVAELAARSDVVTFEIEHADTSLLDPSSPPDDTGSAVRPSSAALETIRDKWLQRSALEAAGIPGPRAALWARPGAPDGAGETADSLDETVGRAGGAQDVAGTKERPDAPDGAGATADRAGGSPLPPGMSHPDPLPPGMSYPVVQKLRRGGYDGRGVTILRSESDSPLGGESLVEECVSIEREVSVLVARTPSGAEAVYPPVLMEFDHEANINTLCALPSGLAHEHAQRASEIAAQAVRSLDIVGICAVELFITTDGRILVNELAPRPHNSGHLTIEASATSQFEQHLRAILDLPLGSTQTVRPAVMVNLLGQGEAGDPSIEGLNSLLALPEVHLHLYDKRPSKPGRKMGHVTVCGETIDVARERAAAVRRTALVTGISSGNRSR